MTVIQSNPIQNQKSISEITQKRDGHVYEAGEALKNELKSFQIGYLKCIAEVREHYDYMTKLLSRIKLIL